MIDAQNDDDLDEVELKLKNKIKTLGKSVKNLNTGILSNDLDITTNS
jgi:hypothetical protein